MRAVEGSGEAPVSVLDLRAVRRQALEDEQLRLLATAVGDHPLPPEQISRLEAVRHARRALAEDGPLLA